MVELRQAGRHFPAAGPRRRHDDQVAARLDIIVLPVAVVTHDKSDIGGISLDIVKIKGADPQIIEFLPEFGGCGLTVVFRDDDASDVEPPLFEHVLEAECVLLICNAKIAADLLLLDGFRAYDDDDLRTVLELLQHPELIVRGKTRQYAGRVIVIIELAAEFKVQFSEFVHALHDPLRLKLQVEL